MNLTVHTVDTAPEASKPLLEAARKKYGFDLNLFGVMAESPLALAAYTQLSGLLEKHSVLTPEEQQVAMITVSVQNGCEYCVAAHSTVAGMVGVDEGLVNTLRDGGEPDNSKTAALVRFVRQLIDKRGWVPVEDQQAFLDAGYTTQHVLDLITILALKTLSNTTNHLAETPLDEAFAPKKWVKWVKGNSLAD